MRRAGGRRTQRGMALLTAIILVALGTILAANIGFDNAMTARRTATTFGFDQALLVAQSAEALAAYALREDAQSTDGAQSDHPAERWAQPLGPVEVVPESGITLEAALQDLQGRLNLNDLLRIDAQTGQLVANEKAVKTLRELLTMLEIEEKWADLIVDWIDPDVAPTGFDGAEDNVYLSQAPPYRAANMPITSTSELLALPEFGRERFRRLAPYVAALPPGTPLNVCTASGEVLDAVIAAYGDDEGYRQFSRDPESLAKSRESACFPTPDDLKALLKDPAAAADLDSVLGQKSNYFRLTSIVTVGTAEFTLYSLLKREGGAVRLMLRTQTPD